MLSRRTLPLPPLIILALLLGFAGSRSASDAASNDAFTTTLYPGWNLVGWVDADVSVERVFEDIAELQSIRSTSQGSSWHVSRANAAGSSAERILKLGRGYWFYVGGARPLSWSRMFEAQAASRELGSGNQLVAWAGLDDVPLSGALSGVPAEVRRAWRWDAAGQQLLFWRPGGQVAQIESPNPYRRPLRRSASSGGVGLQRGEAIGITIVGTTRWRQPIGALPPMEFRGDVPQNIREEAQADLRWVVEHFGKEFGMAADTRRLRVVVARFAGDVTGKSEHRGVPLSASVLVHNDPRAEITIFMGMQEWARTDVDRSVDRSTAEPLSGRLVLLHEYYHAIQAQLAGVEFLSVPSWLVEGGPTWLLHQLGDSTVAVWRDEQAASQFVQLDGTINAPGRWDRDASRLPLMTTSPPHAVGHTFIRWLTARFGEDAHIRFWTRFARPEFSSATWQRVFEAAYGIEHLTVFEDFATWLRDRHPVVTGQIVAPQRIDVPGMYLSLTNGRSSPILRIFIEADGSFRVAVPKAEGYRFALALKDLTCAAYAGLDGKLRSYDGATPFAVESGGHRDIVIDIEDDYCQAIVQGRVFNGNARASRGRM